MTRATARALDAVAVRAFPMLCRTLALAAAVTFVMASLALVRALATLHLG